MSLTLTKMLTLCFADDAVVHDEGRDYRGLHAIRSSKKETQTKYKYVMEPLDASVSGKTPETSRPANG